MHGQLDRAAKKLGYCCIYGFLRMKPLMVDRNGKYINTAASLCKQLGRFTERSIKWARQSCREGKLCCAGRKNCLSAIWNDNDAPTAVSQLRKWAIDLRECHFQRTVRLPDYEITATITHWPTGIQVIGNGKNYLALRADLLEKLNGLVEQALAAATAAAAKDGIG